MAKRKKKASSNRKVSRRALLKGAGAAVAAVTASLFIPRMVHSEVVKIAPCPTWDRLLNHISHQTVGLQSPDRTLDRTPELDRWVHGLVMRPHEPQPALLLIGPENSGKRTFHHAMGLLLPDHSVIQYPQQVYHARLEPAPSWALDPIDWNTMLERAWLIAADGHPGRIVKLFGADRFQRGRYLKWCLTVASVLPCSLNTWRLGSAKSRKAQSMWRKRSNVANSSETRVWPSIIFAFNATANSA